MPDKNPKIAWDWDVGTKKNRGTDGMGIIAAFGIVQVLPARDAILQFDFTVFCGGEVPNGEQLTKLCQRITDILHEETD